MEARQSPDLESDETPTRVRGCLPGLRILLVDDDAALRRALHRLLAGEGALVWEACDGREALDQVGRGTYFDVVLLDLEMPNLRGTLVARVLRASPDVRRVGALIGMSGSGPPADAERSLFDELLSKPFSPEHLLSVVRSCGQRSDSD